MIIIIIFGSVFLKVRNFRRISTLLSSWQLVIHSDFLKFECFPLVFPQLTWAYWQRDIFLVKKENEWFSNYLAFSDSTWRNSNGCLRVTMEKWKNGRASHHSPIRLNSQSKRISVLRVTAGFFVFLFFVFLFFVFLFFCFVLFFSVIDWQTTFQFLLRVSWRCRVPKKAESPFFSKARVTWASGYPKTPKGVTFFV